MTKLRAPLTIDAALTRAAGLLPGGWASLAELTGRSPSMVRAWSDPDRREQLPLRDALLIDQAVRTQTGEAPLLGWYAAQLDLSCSPAQPVTADFVSRVAEVVRECGEANAALVEAAQPGTSDCHPASHPALPARPAPVIAADRSPPRTPHFSLTQPLRRAPRCRTRFSAA